MTDLLDSAAGSERHPDPRVERSRRVILSAALDELGECGYGGLTIEAVAARAGVGKSTIYRHWPGKLQLVEDAISTLKAAISPPVGTTSRERLVDVLSQIATNVADSTWSTCLPAILDASERDPEVMEIHRRFALERRQLLLDLLAEGVAAREISAELDPILVAECLVGPIFVRRLLFHEVFGADGVAALVDQVLGPVPGSR